MHESLLEKLKTSEDDTWRCGKKLKEKSSRQRESAKVLEVEANEKDDMANRISSLNSDYRWLSWGSLGLLPALAAICQLVAKRARSKEQAMKADLEEAEKALSFTQDYLRYAVQVQFYSLK
jgi:hypothetical protein